ncbi:hypothetical protein LCGC14_2384690, partial [marine sediment metagenome]
MKTFSLLVPTRKREGYLREYFESIVQTAKYPQRLTVLVAYDDDDEITANLIPTIKKYSFKIRWCKRGRSNFINEDYYNWLARQSNSGDMDYVFANADD